MQMRHRLVYLFTTLGLCLPVHQPQVRAQEAVKQNITSQSNQSRPDPSKPTPVTVGIYLIDFDKLDEKNQSFELEGYLFLTWKDKRLAFDPKKLRTDTRAFQLGEIWSPSLRFINVKGQRETIYTDLFVKPDGTVSYRERFNGTFYTEMNLNKFPFDSQKLQLLLEPTDTSNNGNNVVFIENKAKIGKSKTAFLTGWNILNVTSRTSTRYFDIDHVSIPQFVYEVNITRVQGSYVWNIFAPLLLITIISWAVFWSRSFESNVVIAYSSLLSAIAFNIVIAEELPKVAYITFINGFVFLVYIFICLSVLQIVFKHYLYIQEKREYALKLDHTSRWLFPTLFSISNIILILVFFI